MFCPFSMQSALFILDMVAERGGGAGGVHWEGSVGGDGLRQTEVGHTRRATILVCVLQC